MQLLDKAAFLNKELYLRMWLFVIATFLKQSVLFKNAAITNSHSLK